jgi:folate-binding protein YgfZ
LSEEASLEGFRLRAGDPAVPGELGPTTIPLEAGMEDAVHENKGCYPGQEVIERIRSMGQVPRQLAIVQGGGNPPPLPAKITVESQEVGTLTSAEKNPLATGWIGLAFVRRQFARPELPFAIGEQGVTVKFPKKAKAS